MGIINYSLFQLLITTHRKWVTITEAITNMSAFTQLTDGVLNVIKVLVDDTEVIK